MEGISRQVTRVLAGDTLKTDPVGIDGMKIVPAPKGRHFHRDGRRSAVFSMKLAWKTLGIGLLLGAVISALFTWFGEFNMADAWSRADARGKRAMLYGEFAPTIRKVQNSVPPREGLVLYSSVDPALLPYALFPRAIYQVAVDPETNRMFMDLPPSPYPKRSPDSFPAAWVLRLTPANLWRGGDLFPLRKLNGPAG